MPALRINFAHPQEEDQLIHVGMLAGRIEDRLVTAQRMVECLTPPSAKPPAANSSPKTPMTKTRLQTAGTHIRRALRQKAGTVKQLDEQEMSSPTEANDTKNADLFFKWISRYLIVLSGTCRLPNGEEGKFNYSGCLVSYKSRHFVLTVGHAFTDLEDEVFNRNGKITGAVLADYFGLVPKSKEPFPFNMFDFRHTHENDATTGLDYALVELSDLHAGFLKANAVESIPLESSSLPSASAPDSFIVIGFPEERVKCVMQPTNPVVEMEVEPNGLKLERLPDDTSKMNPRFVGKILDLGDLKSTKGFSGGPILAIVNRQDRPADCHVLGIQESWNQVDTVYGCLLDRIFEHAKPWLDECAGAESQTAN